MVKKPRTSHTKISKKTQSAKQDLAYFKDLAKKNLAGWQRAQADYQNLVKRTAAEGQKCQEFANEELISELLPIVDNFQHATDHLPPDLKDNDWVQGILFIQTQLEKILANQNVVPIEAVGKKFNPDIHEATAREKVKDRNEKDTVLAETQKGYKMNGKVIRAARVKVGV
ncbi:nucleotide exchange factor GrpE [Patescibacteria group bacterium]